MNLIYQISLSNYFASKPLYLDEPTRKKPNIRKLVEQPWQQTKAEMWDEVTDTLCNLDFIQAKAAAKMTYELVDDFNTVLQVIPDNQENIRQDNERQARMDKYTHDLILYAKGEIRTLKIPESITSWTEEQINAEIERIKTSPSRADKLKDYKYFLGQEKENLQEYANRFSYFTLQQAWNYSNEGPLGKEANQASPDRYKYLLLRRNSNRQQWNPIPEIMQTLKGHLWKVTSVSMTPDGHWAFTSSYDHSCILWDMTTGKAHKILKWNAISKKSVSLTPDGKWAISSSGSSCVLLDLTTGEPIHFLKGHTSEVLAVDITPDGKRAISGSSDHTCILWDLTTGVAHKTLTGHTSVVKAVAITPDGQKAFSGSNDNTCIFWELASGEILHCLKGHTNHVNAVTMTPDGKLGISGSADYTCIFWDLNLGTEIKILKGHTLYVEAVSITPDGQKAITGSSDHTCILWDMKSGKAIKTLNGHSQGIYAVYISPDGRQALSASEDCLCIQWNLQSGRPIQTFNCHMRGVSAIAITPNEQKAVTGHADGTCILWNLNSSKQILTLKRSSLMIQKILITPDGQKAISSSSDNPGIIWDLNIGSACQCLEKSQDTELVSITPDGQRIMTLSDNSCIQMRNIRTGQLIITLHGHTEDIETFSITQNGQMGVSGSRDKTCILWDMKSGQLIQRLEGHSSTIETVSFTPDNQRAISGSLDGTFILWSTKTGLPILRLKADKDYWFDEIVITPDGKRAISRSARRGCILWNLKNGKVIHKFTGITSNISAVCITPDGQRAILTSSRFNTFIVWDLNSGKDLAQYIASSGIPVIVILSNGILLGCNNGKVDILNVDRNLLRPGAAITTISQIWDFEFQRYQELSADCPLCGHRFTPPDSVLETINKITSKANLKPNQSPCLELPDEAWEEPGLLGECPNCLEKIKFNPFFGSDVNGIVNYISSLERNSVFQEVLDKAEKSFKEEKWDDAYNSYLKLVQQGKFDINDMRYKMAVCRINSLTFRDLEIIKNIEFLVKLLQEKGGNNKADLIIEKLKVRLETIEQEERNKNKSKPWWKR